MKGPKNKSKHSPTAKKGVRAEIILSEEGSFLEQPIPQIPQNEPPLDQRETTIRNKELFIKAYAGALLTVSDACERIHIDRSTYYDWMKNDPEFKKAIIDAEEAQANLVEHELLTLVKGGDGASVRYYLDRRVARYHPKQVLTHNIGNKTLEDLLDEDNAIPNAEDTTSIDRGTDKDPQQTEGNSSLPLERGAEILLGSQDASELDPES